MLQAPRRQALKIARLRKTIKESLKRHKAEFDRHLREQFGARLKGWEIRGSDQERRRGNGGSRR